MATGKLRRVFPGNNTCYGFYSLYQHIVGADARRIFIIKGGPGVGKSTFMRSIGEALLAIGYDVDFCHCSSDNQSLDGIYVPKINVALLDGTAPHVVDPKHPGAVDEIIHLGDFWDEGGITDHRADIIELNRTIGMLFTRAYGYLAQARLLREEVESYLVAAGTPETAEINRLNWDLTNSIFSEKPTGLAPASRHLFASAITPDGCINHFPTLFDNLDRRVVVCGASGHEKAAVVGRLYQEAQNRGYYVEAFHCALIPDHLEHLIIPELKMAVVTSKSYHFYQAKEGDTLVDLDRLIDTQKLDTWRADINEAQDRLRSAIDRALTFLHRAKTAHDQMENYYVPYMDFASINALRDKTLERILAYATS